MKSSYWSLPANIFSFEVWSLWKHDLVGYTNFELWVLRFTINLACEGFVNEEECRFLSSERSICLEDEIFIQIILSDEIYIHFLEEKWNENGS